MDGYYLLKMVKENGSAATSKSFHSSNSNRALRNAVRRSSTSDLFRALDIELSSPNAERSSSALDDAKSIALSNTNAKNLFARRVSSESLVTADEWEKRQKANFFARENGIGERVAQMLESENFSDVIFIVGEEKERIRAHRFVLSIGSEVFGAMLNNSHFHREVSAEEPWVHEIHVPDIEPAVFRLVLKYLYTDTVQLTPDNVMIALYAARKYAITSLETLCTKFLKNNLCADNAFLILMQARLFDQVHLAKACLDIIDCETIDAFRSEAFLDIDQKTLCEVLRRNSLRVKEVPVYMATLRWAEAQCIRRRIDWTKENLREALGDALFLIRFPLMSLGEFADKVARDSKLLTEKELVDLFLSFAAHEKPQIPFPATERSRILGKELSVNRFQRIESRWGYNGSADRIRFTVDVPIYVTALGLFGSMHGPHLYEGVIEIVDCGTNKTVASNEIQFRCDGSHDVFRVPFKEPVEITPGVIYMASAFLQGPDSYYGMKGLRRISRQTVCGSVSTVVTFQFSFAPGNNNGSSVEDGQIPEIVFCMKLR